MSRERFAQKEIKWIFFFHELKYPSLNVELEHLTLKKKNSIQNYPLSNKVLLWVLSL